MTAMGVQWAENGTCTGVLYPVSEKELSRFDRREIGYDRQEIPIENVDRIDYLDEEHYDSEEHVLFLQAVAGKREDVRIWVYVPSNPCPPDEDHPIAQTYVDIILQGCLDIHVDFAREFIEETKGWNPQELLTDEDDDSDDEDIDDEDGEVAANQALSDENTSDVIAWVNDRDRPIYMRADTDYSQKEGPQLDRLLRRHRPEFRRRKKRASVLKKPKGHRKRPELQTSNQDY
jgi:hypothetical protein